MTLSCPFCKKKYGNDLGYHMMDFVSNGMPNHSLDDLIQYIIAAAGDDNKLKAKIQQRIKELQADYDNEVKMGYARPPYLQSFAFEFAKNELKALLPKKRNV